MFLHTGCRHITPCNLREVHAENKQNCWHFSVNFKRKLLAVLGADCLVKYSYSARKITCKSAKLLAIMMNFFPFESLLAKFKSRNET